MRSSFIVAALSGSFLVAPEYIGEPLLKISPHLSQLSRRDNVGCRQTCPAKDDHMSTWGNWEGCTSSYTPGSGQLILTNQDVYKHDRNLAIWKHDKCWTDVYSVESENVQLPWRPLEQAIDCGSTSSCTRGNTSTYSQCATWSESLTTTKELGVEVLEKISAGVGQAKVVTYDKQACVSAALTTTCTWTDGGCHAIWGSDNVVRVWGYIQRVCNYADDHKSPEAIWSHDFIIDFPTGDIAPGCDGKCVTPFYDGPSMDPAIPTSTAVCITSATWNNFAAVTSASRTESTFRSEDPTTSWIGTYSEPLSTFTFTSSGVTVTSTSFSLATVTALETNTPELESAAAISTDCSRASNVLDTLIVLLLFYVCLVVM